MTVVGLLELSTVHLPRAEWANMGGTAVLWAYQTPYGAFMPVPPPDEYAWRKAEHGISEEMIRLWQYAEDKGCRFILFDCDAETDPDLPEFPQQ